MRKSWLPLGLLVAAVMAFIGTAIGARMSLSDLLVRDAERREALQLENELQRLLTRLVDIETGQRGFIITGLRPFLRPHEEALDELGAHRAALRRRMADSQVPEAMLQRLDRLIDARVEQSREIIARRAEGRAVLNDLDAYVEGKRLMDELRLQVGELARGQQQRIAAIDAQAQSVRSRTTRLTQSLLGAGLVTLVLALLLMYRERRLRDQAEDALLQANALLERKVAQRTDALTRALARIRSFASELERGIEVERRRLAREVHDQIGQVGTAIKMTVAMLRAEVPASCAPLLQELDVVADETVRSARQISAALRPPLLDELGLEAALGHCLQGLSRQSGLQIQLELTDAGLPSATQANALFRIVQEACTNVLRHAQARSLRVLGRALAEGGRDGYELQVIDDGRGPGQARPDASGLRGMRERAALAGGSFDFGAAPGRGSRVRAWLPLSPPVAGDDLQSDPELEAWT